MYAGRIDLMCGLRFSPRRALVNTPQKAADWVFLFPIP